MSEMENENELTLRPEVHAFAQAMERKLRANDHKPGWKQDDPGALMDRVEEEAIELRCAASAWRISGLRRTTIAEHVLEEAADVANMAMMVADVCGGLAINPPAPSAET